MALLTRAAKGSALTYGEVDGNWTELERRVGDGWQDLVMSVNVGGGANSPTWNQFRNGIYAYAFSPTTMNECWSQFHLRHDFKWGTMCYPHVHFSSNTTNTGTVRWGIEWTYARRADSVGGDNTGVIDFPATQTIYIEHEILSGEQYRHQVTEPADGNGIPGTGLETDGLILTRFFRDATHINDTFPDDVYLLTVDIHHEVDKDATPTRQPPFYP